MNTFSSSRPAYTLPYPKFTQALPWVFFVMIVFFINFFPRSIVGSMLVPMQQEFGISHADATSVMLYLSFGFCTSMACSSILSRRLCPRQIISLSVIISGTALLGMHLVHNLFSARLVFTFLGLGAGLYFPSGIATISRLVELKDWGKALSVHELSPSLSFILVPIAAEFGLRVTSWQNVFSVCGAVSILLGVLFFFFGRGGDTPTGKADLPPVRTLITMPKIWYCAALLVLCLGAEFIPFAILPLYMVKELGMDFSSTNTVLALSRIACPFLILLAGIATDKFSTISLIRVVFIIEIIVHLGMGLCTGFWLSAAIVVQAVITAFIIPASFKFVAECFPVAQQPLAISIAMPIAMLTGTGLLPALFGVIGDIASFSYGFILMAIGHAVLLLFPVPPKMQE